MKYWQGITIKIGSEYGLVTEYHQDTESYQYVSAERLGVKTVKVKDIERVDIPIARDVAEILRESNYKAGAAYLSEEGWDIVSAFQENDHRDLNRVDPSPPTDYGIPHDDLIWDPDSHTFVRRNDDETDDLHNPGPWGLDPAMHTFRAKNPEFTGIYARIEGSCEDCGGVVSDGICESCGNYEPEQAQPVQPHKDQTSTYLDVDTRSPHGRDDSFPSMISKARASLSSMKNFAHVRDEAAWHEARVGADLESCPECGDFMHDTLDHKEAQCHACGHRQGIVYNVSKQKEALALAPLALAPLALRIAPMLGQAFMNMAGGGEEETGSDVGITSSTEDAIVRSAADVGIAVDNSGQDVMPNAGSQGFTEDHGDSPELLKDTNDIGGTDSHDILNEIQRLMPEIEQYANDPSRSAADHPQLVALDKWLAENIPGYTSQNRTASTYHQAARRPRMCPYHTNLIDYAMALNDPALALKSLGGLMYSEQSCQGGYQLLNKNENPIKCKYKPEMILPGFWEKREEETERRRLEREQQQALEPPTNQEQIQEEVQAVPVNDPLEVIQQDENSVTIPAEQINEMKNEPEAPAAEAIELPTDYDPEAYWEADDVPDFGPPELTTPTGSPTFENFQAPEGYQLVPVEPEMASAVDQSMAVAASKKSFDMNVDRADAGHAPVTFRCPKCGGDVDNGASNCPTCGITEQEAMQISEQQGRDPNHMIVNSTSPEAPENDEDYAADLANRMSPDSGWTSQTMVQVRQILLQQGMNEERVNNVVNSLIADAWDYHPQNEYFGDESTHPSRLDGATFAGRRSPFRQASPAEMSDSADLGGTDAETAGHISPVTQTDNTEETTTHITDGDGEPLQVGGTYDMLNEAVDHLPETVKVTRIDPYYVEFEVINDDMGFSFENRVHAKTIASQGIKFQKHTDNPNAEGRPVEPPEMNADAPTFSDATGVTDLSTGRSAHLAWLVEDVATEVQKEASRSEKLNPRLAWLKDDGMSKEAGKNYSPMEQRELIGESGSARNLDKLQLDGTHYVEAHTLGDEQDIPDSHFLF